MCTYGLAGGARRLARRLAWLLCGLLAAGLVVLPQAAHAADGTVTITGRGYGHGRGMGQWGALGYAVDYGWGYRQILDHFYGGTTHASDAPTGNVSVELEAQSGRDLIATGPGLKVNGATTGSGAVRVRTVTGGLQVDVAGGCGGPWQAQGPARSQVDVSTSGGSGLDGLVQLCTSAGVRGYEGFFRVVPSPEGQQTVNYVPLDGYLRGVVPRESPASWADLGGGAGMNALQAQAVAARSYALSSQWRSWAMTCDTINCQVYGGAWFTPAGGARRSLYDARSDRAVSSTTGEVRRGAAGRIARTEFSASTGGYTAGGAFPAVRDDGDGIVANPNRSWTLQQTLTQVSARLGVGEVRGIRVTGRTGLGPDGGRVTQVTVDTASGVKTLTGAQVRSRLGLKSDWFTLSSISDADARAYVDSLFVDLLGRPADGQGLTTWVGALQRGSTREYVARGVAASSERYAQIVDRLYVEALGRHADASGRATWVATLEGPATYNDVAASVYGSSEAVQRLGAGSLEAWVDGVYQRALGRAADPAGLRSWTEFARSYGTVAAARGVVVSGEARERRLQTYYAELMDRALDPAGRSSYLPMLAQDGDVTVPVILGASQEYWNRAIA